MDDHKQTWINHPTDEIVKEYAGFVYLITNHQTQQQYIGRKYFHIKKSKKQSNWQSYWGSSDWLKEVIKETGLEYFTKVILSIHKTKGQVNRAEVETQWEHDVLSSLIIINKNEAKKLYYNKCINGKYYNITKFLEDGIFIRGTRRELYKYPDGTIVQLKKSHPLVLNDTVTLL